MPQDNCDVTHEKSTVNNFKQTINEVTSSLKPYRDSVGSLTGILF